MTTANHILRDLQSGQSSAAAIAHRLRQPEKIITAYLDDLELAGQIQTSHINDTIKIYRLTHQTNTQNQ